MGIKQLFVLLISLGAVITTPIAILVDLLNSYIKKRFKEKFKKKE